MVFKNVESALEFYKTMKESKGHTTSLKSYVRELIVNPNYTYNEAIKDLVRLVDGNCKWIDVGFRDDENTPFNDQDLWDAYFDISKCLEDGFRKYEAEFLANYGCDGKSEAFNNIENASFNKKPLKEKNKRLKNCLRKLKRRLIQIDYIPYKKPHKV